MNKILSKRFFSDNVAELVVEAPLIARSRRAGHFVIIRVDAHSERVPLTISAADIERGTITLVKEILGEEWLNNEYFRFGASRLANNLLSSIVGKETKYF